MPIISVLRLTGSENQKFGRGGQLNSALLDDSEKDYTKEAKDLLMAIEVLVLASCLKRDTFKAI